MQNIEPVPGELPTFSLANLPVDQAALVSVASTSFLARLASFEAPYLEERLLSKGVLANHGEFQDVFSEFKKFVALNYLYDESFVMLSPAVDSLWHQFILFTRSYTEFCLEFLGRYLHHEPAGSLQSDNTEKAVSRFYMLYERTFGAVNGLWQQNARCSSCWTCKS